MTDSYTITRIVTKDGDFTLHYSRRRGPGIWYPNGKVRRCLLAMVTDPEYLTLDLSKKRVIAVRGIDEEQLCSVIASCGGLDEQHHPNGLGVDIKIKLTDIEIIAKGWDFLL